MVPSLHTAQPLHQEPDSREQHLAHGRRAALALTVVLAVFGTLFLVVGTQVVDDSPSTQSTVPDLARPTPFAGA